MLGRIAKILGLEGSKSQETLYDLAVAHKKAGLPADIASFAAKTPGIPAILRTVKNRKLTEAEIVAIGDVWQLGTWLL